MSENFVGIDVSKDWLDVHIRPQHENLRVSNTPAEIVKLTQQFQKLKPACVVLEATGGLERNVVRSLSDASVPVVVMNPRQIRDFAKCTGHLAKTDRLDAAVLAHYAEAIRPEIKPLASQEEDQLKALNTYRHSLVELIVAQKNRHRTATSPSVQKSIERILQNLQQELDKVDQELNQHIQRDPQKAQRQQWLETVPGIAAIVSQTLVTQLPELGQLTNKQISHLVGVAPLNRDSGLFKGKRYVWGGRALVRSTLYMAGRAMGTEVEGLLSTPSGSWKEQEAGLDSLYAEVIVYGECHGQEQGTLSESSTNHLTSKTVAPVCWSCQAHPPNRSSDRGGA